GQTPEPSRPAAEAPAKDEPPPGACKPIGLTVSGEVVFPLECRDFIERQKSISRHALPPETKPAPTAAEAKPTVQDDKPTGSTDNAPLTEDKSAPGIKETEVKPTEVKPTEIKPPETHASESLPAQVGSSDSIRPESKLPENKSPENKF